MSFDFGDYVSMRRLAITTSTSGVKEEEDSYVSDDDESCRVQNSLRELSLPDWMPAERQGESASVLPTSFENKTIKFTKRPFGFTVEPHPDLGYAMVTKCTNLDLEDLSEMAILKIADRITTGINFRELEEIFNRTSLPVEVTFGEWKMPERMSKQEFPSAIDTLEMPEDAYDSKEFSTESITKEQLPSGNTLHKKWSTRSINPSLTKLIDTEPEKALLIERVSGLNLVHASTLPDQLVDSRQRKMDSAWRLSKKPTNRVSYLHEALKFSTNKYELNFIEDEKGVLDIDGSSTSEEEELVLSSHLARDSFNLARSITYDEAKAKKVWQMCDAMDMIAHQNPANYRPLSFKGVEGNTYTWSKMCVQRVDIIKELVNTEQVYLDGIKELYKVFLEPVSEILNEQEKLTLLNYIPQIIDLSSNLLQEFREANNIAKIFLTVGQHLKIYSRYLVNYTDMCVLVRDLEHQRKFTRYCKKNDIRSKVFYSSCILPVQRGPRYILLLKELRKKTQTDHPMVKDLDNAIAFMDDICHTINKHGKTIEKQHHLFRISSTIKENSLKENGIWPLVKPARTLIREGTILCYESALKKKDHKKQNISSVHLVKAKGVLCNDILLIISKQKVKRLMQVDYIRLIDIEMTKMGKKFFGIHITDTNEEILVFYVHEKLDRDAWSESIRKYMWMAQEINKSMSPVFQA